MAYLSKADWRKHLKNKALSSVKKTGVGDLLGDYEKAVKRKNASAQILSLEKIKKKCPEVKRKFPKLPLLNGYLDSMAREAQIAEDRLADDQKQAAEQDELDGTKSPLAVALKRLRKASEDKPQFFVVTPGKPSTGLVISRKSIKKSNVKEAIALRGKAGPFLQGNCFFDSGKYVFDFPAQPAKGIAKSIKLAARLHAEMEIKVLVRGGGVEFDDESDTDTDMVGDERIASGGAANYPKPESWDGLIQKVQQLPPDKQEAAFSGSLAKITQLTERANKDPDLDMQTRPVVLQGLQMAHQKINAAIEATSPAESASPSNYLTLGEWASLLDKCLRMDPDKRVPAIETLRKKLAGAAATLKADTEITQEGRKLETQVLVDFSEMIKEGVAKYKTTVKGALSTDMGQRLQELERDFDAAQKQKVLPDIIKQEMRNRFEETREILSKGDDEASELSLGKLAAAIKSVLKTVYEETGKQNLVAEQNRVHQSMAKGIGVFKKGAFASGTSDAIFSDKTGIRKDKHIKQLAADFKSCESDPSPQNLEKLSLDGQNYLDLLDKAASNLNPDKPRDKAKLEALEKQADVTRQAVQRVRLLELAQKIEAFGAPPWNDSDNETMAELQVQFFFEEGAISQKNANFGAPPLGTADEGGEGGANEAWWIQRGGTSGGKDSKTYIFKPQEMEATQFVGIPQNGGSVREVLAKSTSDSLAKYGFDLGVCPTHLVNIDTAKLGGLSDSPKGASTLGAMQELADNDGPVSDFVKQVTPEEQEAFKKSVDKKNFGDIAVFDMMFLNMDRHAGNLLVQKGPDGKNTLVPIDHGIGLMEPEGLSLNRQRMTSSQNVMLDGVFPSDELLDAETIANLKSIDAKAMADELRQKQLDLEKRHPETAGKIDHGEFDRMAKRVEFMQVAADTLNVKELFKANAVYADEINAAKPSELPRLIAKIKTKFDAVEKARLQFEDIKEGSGGRNPEKQLSNLGWAVGWGPDKTLAWMDENMDFVIKVVRGQITNPEAVAELADGLRDLNDQAFEKRLKGQPLGEKLFELQKEIAKRRKESLTVFEDAPEITGQKVYDTEHEKLGGEAAEEDACRIFSDANYENPVDALYGMRCLKRLNELGGEKALNEALRVFDWDHAKTPEDLLGELAAWKEINAKGGMKAYIALGGIKDERPSTTLEIFNGLLSMQKDDQFNKVLQIDDRKIAPEQIKLVTKLVEDYHKILPTIAHDQQRKKALPKSFAVIKPYVDNSEWDKAQGGLLRLHNQMEGLPKKQADKS